MRRGRRLADENWHPPRRGSRARRAAARAHGSVPRFPPSAPAAAEDSAPLVSPDRIEDVASIRADPYPDFDAFAWRAFIALNWPP